MLGNFPFKRLSIAALVLPTIGCTSIDVPVKPERPASTEISDSIPQQFFNAEKAPLPISAQWWEGFNDETLTFLIEKTLANNRQLDVAEANIKIANANLTLQTLGRDYSTNGNGNGNANLGRTSAPNRNFTGTLSGSLGASWEYDAFGRIEATIKAAELNAEAAQQARQDIAVIVSSETALAYMDLRGAQKRLAVAQENAETQAQSLSLLEQLFENGRATQLDINRAEAQYRTTRSDLPRFQAVIDNAISRLAVLTGENAAQPENALLSLKQAAAPIPSFTAGFDIGSPQDLIRRRPDIRAAEVDISRRLVLSDIERTRLFPTVTFNADISALFGNGNRLDRLSSFGFGLGPAIRWEGPDLRRVRADIDITDEETKRAYKVYEETVLQALADVEVALSNRINEQRRQLDLSRAETAARAALEIATLRFEEGIDDFLDVLDAQRTLLASQDRLAENQLQTVRLTVLAYRELGGI